MMHTSLWLFNGLCQWIMQSAYACSLQFQIMFYMHHWPLHHALVYILHICLSRWIVPDVQTHSAPRSTLFSMATSKRNVSIVKVCFKWSLHGFDFLWLLRLSGKVLKACWHLQRPSHIIVVQFQIKWLFSIFHKRSLFSWLNKGAYSFLTVIVLTSQVL